MCTVTCEGIQAHNEMEDRGNNTDDYELGIKYCPGIVPNPPVYTYVEYKARSSTVRSSSIEGCLPFKVIFHYMLYSIIGHLPLEVIFYWRSSSIEGCLLLEVVFHWRLSSIGGCLPLEVKHFEFGPP